MTNHILEESKFLMNILPNTKDPFEYKKRFTMAISKNDLGDVLSNAPFIIDDVIHSQTKIGCFVKEEGNLNDIDSLTSITNSAMWAHYGDDNEGVVLVFDLNEFLKSCKNVTEYDWALKHNKVDYDCVTSSKNNPALTLLDDFDDYSELGISKYIFNRSCEFWFCKRKEWCYENEYRVMLFSSQKGPVKVDIKNSLEAIVLGEKVPDFMRDCFKNYCIRNKYKLLSVEFNVNENKYQKYFI